MTIVVTCSMVGSAAAVPMIATVNAEHAKAAKEFVYERTFAGFAGVAFLMADRRESFGNDRPLGDLDADVGRVGDDVVDR
jgi:hypothetical protein